MGVTWYGGCTRPTRSLPKGKIAFVELKAPGEEPRELQVSRHKFLRKLGFKVFVIDRKESIEKMLDEIDGKKKKEVMPNEVHTT